MTRQTRWLRTLIGLGLAGLLGACGGPAAAPTLPPPAVSTAGSPAAPLATRTLPAPGVTTLAPANPTEVPATAAPTAVPVYGPETYPEGVNPLTGLAVEPALLNRIPVAVKITNFPLSARPQWGLSLADVVFEHLAEAGLTRFTAVYLGNDAAKVGSIRSARFIDAELAPMFQAVLVTSGSSFGTMDKLRRTEWFLGASLWRLVSEESAYNCPPLCRETPDDTNTLFASTEAVRQVLATKTTQGTGRADLRGLAFTATAPAGQPVTELYLRFSAAAQVSWRYNAASGRYTRWQEKDAGGELITHLDALTNVPITAANLVLLQANHVNNYVPEDFRDGGNCGVEIQLWTSGPARVFRDGVVVEGRWVRDQTTGMRLQLVDAAGQVIALKPGNTWFDVVGLNAATALNGPLFSVTNKVPDTKTGCPVPPTETPDPLAVPTPTP
ncbi:MAG: DUF3048 domain-containing protein [Anaerolineales bacterium]|nr:DUF3048 domain-containing protein [Anaerolineales bacterium]